MSDELRPYDEYKKAKQEWLGVIPKHWKQSKAKRIFNETSIKNCPEEELLSATQNKGVIPRSMLDTRVVMPTGNLETFKLVQEGNFVISLRSFQGGLEYSKYRGIVSPAYNILEEKLHQNRMYYKHLFKSHDFIGELQRNVTGIRQGKNIDVNDFKEIILPIPPIDEQDKIVKYLDNKLAKINKFIKAKKKLIAVLKEQKQAVINEAVTKGLNPDVKMKPSGIEWLGDIPEHWEVKQLRRITKIVKTGGTPQGADEKYYCEDGFNWYSPGDFCDELYLGRSSRQLSELGIDAVNIHPKDTIMMIGIGGTMGKVSIAKTHCACNQQINAIICKSGVSIEYLVYYLRSIRNHIFATAKYTTLPILNQEETKKIPILQLPLSEQQEIVRHITQKIVVIDKSIAGIEKEIELMTEYRTRLISDVVTGKVDVRDIVIDQDASDESDSNEFEDEVAETEEAVVDDEEGEV